MLLVKWETHTRTCVVGQGWLPVYQATSPPPSPWNFHHGEANGCPFRSLFNYRFQWLPSTSCCVCRLVLDVWFWGPVCCPWISGAADNISVKAEELLRDSIPALLLSHPLLSCQVNNLCLTFKVLALVRGNTVYLEPCSQRYFVVLNKVKGSPFLKTFLQLLWPLWPCVCG